MNESNALARGLNPARRWPAVLFGAVIGAVGALLVASLFDDSNDAAALADEAVELVAVDVTVADLIEEVEWAGELGYRESSAVNGSGGTVTGVVGPGTVVSRGETLVVIDERPTVLFYGETPLYRSVGEGDEGADVFALESNLVALGYDPDATVTVDETYTYNTGLMVARWQEDLGIEASATVEPSDALVFGGAAVVLESPVVGASAVGELLRLAPAEALTVTVPVAVGDATDWEIDQSVAVVLPDESEVAGRVAEIGTEVFTDQTGSTVDVSIELADDVAGLVEGAVVVRTVGDQILGATVVPTRALVALREGGFAVETVDDDGTARLVGIEIGAFDDGIVEVTAGDIAPGDRVVVPQ